MLAKLAFVEKLIDRLDRLSKEDIKTHLLSLTQEMNKYADLLNDLPVGIVEIISEKKLNVINSTAMTFLGVVKNEILYKDISNRPLALEIESLMKDSKQFIRNVKIFEPRERIVQIKKTHNELGQHSFILIFDITQEEMKKQYDERVKLNESILRLAGGVAHEIGNPLNALQIHLNLLDQDLKHKLSGDDVKITSRIETMRSEIGRLDLIVKDFLKTTRKSPLKFKKENLVDIIESALHFFKPEFEENNIVVETEFDPKEIAFLMDKERIYEALVNLIKNSIDAIGKNGKLIISLKLHEKSVSLKIKDSGVGIDEDVIDHIFDAYFTTKSTGTGLGLVSVYHCVAEHGGRIEVKTKKDKGTTFTLMLPIREANKRLSNF